MQGLLMQKQAEQRVAIARSNFAQRPRVVNADLGELDRVLVERFHETNQFNFLPSPREAAGRGRGWGAAYTEAAFPWIDPPPPTPPRHAQDAWGEGSRKRMRI